MLADLPEVVQHYLVLTSLYSRWGFDPDSVRCERVAARSLGVDSDEKILAMVMDTQGNSFIYALGVWLPDMQAALQRGAEIWNRSSQAERDALYRGSPLLLEEHAERIVIGIGTAGIRLPASFLSGGARTMPVASSGMKPHVGKA